MEVRPDTAQPTPDLAGQWNRVLWLDRRIREGAFPDWHALAEEFGCSRRTAMNTVAFLRDSLGAPLEHSRAKRGYHYTEPTFALPSVMLREGELLALVVAQEVAHQYLGTPLEAPLREAVRKIAEAMPGTVRVDLDQVATHFHLSGGSSIETPLTILKDFHQAAREHRWVRMVYYTASSGETREREIEPHFLHNVRGDWMVAAWDHYRSTDRVFMLSRVREYQVLERRFRPRPELDRATYSQHTFLTEHGEAPQEVVLRFDAYQARWIRERTWHPSQELQELEDGGVELRLSVSGEGDLLRWVLGYGRHVEVVAPEHLRQRVAEELRRAASRYEATSATPSR